MEKIEFGKSLKNKAKTLEVYISNAQIDKFYNYMNLLLEWNEKINLTAITEPEEVILKHFIDSITIIKYIKKAEKILDIGTGAGFPGIPLKILEEDKDIILLDSLNKRINFLQAVISNLKLDKVEAIHSRAEDFIKEQRENYDIVISRAVAKLNVLVEYMLPFVKKGGICICMKSADIQQELKEAEKAIKLLGGEIEKIDDIILPNSNIERKIIVIKKINSTPSKYPRKAGIPAKQPIK